MWFNNLAQIDLSQAEIGKKLTKMKNDQEFIVWFTNLIEKANNRYKVSGLPDTCNERVILQSILWYGTFVLFEMNGSILSLPCRAGQNLSLYGDFDKGYVFGRNGFNKEIKLTIPNGESPTVLKNNSGITMGKEGTGVYIRERKNPYPFINFVYLYAQRIGDTMRTLDVQRNMIKRPYMITAQEEVLPTVKKWLNNKNENEEMIVSTGVFDANAVQAIPLTISSDDLKATRELVEWYQAQYDMLCGIQNNSKTDKKANLLESEMESNTESTFKEIQDNVDYMNQQLEVANSQFGTNIKVEVNRYDDICGDKFEDGFIPGDGSESGDTESVI